MNPEIVKPNPEIIEEVYRRFPEFDKMKEEAAWKMYRILCKLVLSSGENVIKESLFVLIGIKRTYKNIFNEEEKKRLDAIIELFNNMKENYSTISSYFSQLQVP